MCLSCAHHVSSSCVCSDSLRPLEAAKIPNESNQNQQKPIIKNDETRGWTRIHQGVRERNLDWARGHQALNQKGRPAGGLRFTQRCVSMPLKIEEKDRTRAVRPVVGQESTKVEELDIDFRMPGLSHAVVKEAEHLRVQELVKKDRKSSSSRSTSCRFAAE